MIRHATANDLPAVEDAYELLFEHERVHGCFSGWRKGIFPAKTMLEDALADGRLYVLRGEKDELLASMVLGSEVPGGINEPMWHYPAREGEVLSIDAICVEPDQQGRGYGTRMMNYALKVATSRSIATVRLAAFERNEPIIGLCGKLAFENCGSGLVMLAGLIPQRQVYFERVM